MTAVATRMTAMASAIEGLSGPGRFVVPWPAAVPSGSGGLVEGPAGCEAGSIGGRWRWDWGSLVPVE
jgi:hypothetical protein